MDQGRRIRYSGESSWIKWLLILNSIKTIFKRQKMQKIGRTNLDEKVMN